MTISPKEVLQLENDELNQLDYLFEGSWNIQRYIKNGIGRNS